MRLVEADTLTRDDFAGLFTMRLPLRLIALYFRHYHATFAIFRCRFIELIFDTQIIFIIPLCAARRDIVTFTLDTFNNNADIYLIFYWMRLNMLAFHFASHAHLFRYTPLIICFILYY